MNVMQWAASRQGLFFCLSYVLKYKSMARIIPFERVEIMKSRPCAEVFISVLRPV